MTARIGVITFPGSLDDRDAQRAIALAGAEPVALWHADHDLQGVDALVLPGGFSYGDYLRAGADIEQVRGVHRDGFGVCRARQHRQHRAGEQPQPSAHL